MELRYIIATFIIFIAVCATPHLERLSYVERGYEAIGGEYMPMVLALAVGGVVIQIANELEVKRWHKIQRQKRLRRKREAEKLCQINVKMPGIQNGRSDANAKVF